MFDLSDSSLWAVRHAETKSNQGGVYMGWSDVLPTEEGLGRAAAIGKDLRGKFTHVFASPLKRASRTAEAMFPEFSIMFDDRLRERGLGLWEGMLKTDVQRQYPEAFRNSHLDAAYTPPGGESLDTMLARISEFFTETPHLARDERMLLVSHNGWIRTAKYFSGEIGLQDIFANRVEQLVPVAMKAPHHARRSSTAAS